MKLNNKTSINNLNFDLEISNNENKLSYQTALIKSAKKSFSSRLRIILACLFSIFLICTISSCAASKANQGEENEDIDKKNKERKAAAPEVIFDSVVQNDVQLYLYAEGTTSPYKSVDIRVRVPGYIRKYFYSHGDIVNQGDQLAQIEQEQYQYALEISKQDLVIAEQKEIQAKKDLERDRPLAKEGIRTGEELLQRETEYRTAVANVKRSKVAVQQAELNLAYTNINAPITGKTTQHLVDENNFVSPGTAEAKLLSITQLDPIYVDFYVSDTQFADLKERIGYREKFDEIVNENQDTKNNSAGKINPEQKNPKKENEKKENNKGENSKDENGKDEKDEFIGFKGGTFEASLTSATEAIPNDFMLKGILKGVIDNRIAYDSGQVTIRGELRNPLININNSLDYLIYPGQICVVRIPYEIVSDAVLINEEAILTDLDTKYVFVVQKGMYTPKPNPLSPVKQSEKDLEPYETDLAFRRDIKIGRLLDNQQRIILYGLKPGEKYIVKGIQRARHNSPINAISIGDFNRRRNEEENGISTEQTEQDDNAKETIQENKEKSQKQIVTGTGDIKPPINNDKK